ncbi:MULTISPECIES: type VI secretion system baseplate subunit TssE [Pseudomonas]|uniref:type VI secretion system baseplate subunit TssE n=1 Tax=Pseudomonas TaxID=286 RepID=UPI00257E3B13|nr:MULTISPECIES: type VI secretion system baseplate subunit TssE [Pseudomonas]
MSYGSLFERLNGTAQLRKGWSREVAVMASVADHLGKMLSTRTGSVQTLPDYGLPDLNDMGRSLHDSLLQARTAIERFVGQYEPRLTSVRVVPLPCRHDPLTLSFTLDGLLNIDGQTRPISFTARLDGSGKVRVQRNS